jgi:hypothetical protein
MAAVAPMSGGTAESGDKPIFSGQIRQANPLIQLAIQFGQARGAERGLRSALGTPPNSDDIQENVNDPHFRGSILVSAVFDAFMTVYMRRGDDLFRIYHAGGADRSDDLPGPLAEQLAHYASETAGFFFQLCARALDYCPPLDLTFGDFLRALITVAKDLDPVDKRGVRDALMQAFRLRGIYPESASFFSEDALCWPPVPEGTLPPIAGLVFGSPNGLTGEEKNINGNVLREWANTNRTGLGLDPSLPLTVPSFHPVVRTMDNGRLRVEMVVEVIQSREASFDSSVPEAGSFPFRGGVTLIIDAPELESDNEAGTVALAPLVRFAISKAITGNESQRREQTQRAFAIGQGLATGDTKDPNHFQANFGLLHEEY